MKEWHVKHTEQTLVKFVIGLSEDASYWQKRMDKKYSRIGKVSKRIEYDIKHGVTNMQFCSFLQLIRNQPCFYEVRTPDGSMERLDEIQAYFKEPSVLPQYNDKWYSSLIRAE
jgi:hypothetical protein